MENVWGHAEALVAAWGLKVLAALVIIILGRWTAKLCRNGLRRVLEKADTDPTLVGFFTSGAHVALMVVVELAALNQLGVQTTSFIAIIGAAGLAVALAFQGSLSNLSAGVMLIVFRPMKPGDFVEAAGSTGIIESIEIFTTVMRTGDNIVIYVPNAKIIGDTITNYSVKDSRRIDLVIGVGYDDDLSRVKATLQRVLEEDNRVHADPAPAIGVSELGESAVKLVVRPWVNTADYARTRRDLLERIKIEFDAAGIRLPYPQRDVHVHEVKNAA